MELNETVVTAVTGRLDEVAHRMDNVWVLILTFIVFFMQLGFLLLEAGSVPVHHSKTIMMKNISDACFGAIGWYFGGYPLYSGTFAVNEASEFSGWFQSYVFAVTTSTILSGGVACRIEYKAYLIYSTVLSCLVYPFAGKWTWGEDQWLNNEGYLDFAGSGAVHTVGGCSALVGAYFLGARKHRFDANGKDNQPPGSSDTSVIIGAFIIWFCWFAFNAGSSVGVMGDLYNQAARAAINTLLSSTTGGITGIFLSHRNPRKMLPILVNSILGALVGVTGSCAYIDSYSAIIIGFCASLLCAASSAVVAKLQIDDPVDAFSVHGACGMFGVLAIGIFHMDDGLVAGKGKLFVIQLLGMATMAGLAIVCATVFFALCSRIMKIRISEDEEMVGLDYVYMQEGADEKLTGQKIQEFNEIRAAKQRIKKVYVTSTPSSVSSKASERVG